MITKKVIPVLLVAPNNLSIPREGLREIFSFVSPEVNNVYQDQIPLFGAGNYEIARYEPHNTGDAISLMRGNIPHVLSFKDKNPLILACCQQPTLLLEKAKDNNLSLIINISQPSIYSGCKELVAVKIGKGYDTLQLTTLKLGKNLVSFNRVAYFYRAIPELYHSQR
ncbi:MAG: hypothetical protein ACI9AR_000298 [Flavobacteriaceae bacterium]|jgi:hypothetical protein